MRQHDVFISYSSKDADAALAICRTLEQRGIRCWIAPRDIPGGADYGDVIDRAIIGCGVFVLIFSHSSMASQWVRGEVNLAFTENKPIVPYRMDDAALTGAMRLILNQMHWLDCSVDGCHEELVATVARLLKTSGATSFTTTEQVPHAATTAPTPTSVTTEQGTASRRKRPWWLWMLCAVMVVAAIVAGVVFGPKRGAELPDGEPTAVTDSVAMAQIEQDSVARVAAEEAARRREAKEQAMRAERAEQERLRKAREAEERAARERDSLQRVLQNKERAEAERQRIERELDSLEQVRAEQERIAKQTAERLAAEKAAREAAERAECEAAERAAAEARAKADREAKAAAEKAAAEKAAAEKAAAEKARAEQEQKQKQEVQKLYKVGDLYNDDAGRQGIVFKTDATGAHGTIISLVESNDKIEWCKMTDDEPLVNIEATSRTNGAENQRQAMLQPKYNPRYPAFVWCTIRKGSGWYLPSVEELQLFSQNAALLKTVNAALKQNGGKPIGGKGYWSSTEVSVRKAYSIYINENTGNYTSEEGKYVRNYVRAAYRF